MNALAVADHAAPSPAEALYSQDFRLDELDFRLYESVLTRDQMGDRQRRCVMSTGTHTTTLAKEPFINVTSFKRDGTAVATPVWCVGKNGSLLVFSEADSGKVKRIRHDPHVSIAPCSFRGKPRGPAVEADATVLHDTEEVEALLTRKYRWTWRGYNLVMAAVRRLRRQARPDSVTIKIALR